jgi:uncharacterized protein
MKLEKEFTVGAPLDRAWRALSDVGVLATSIPGAQLRASDDVYTGQLEIFAIGERIVCETTVRSVDQDHDEHVATILLHARQVGGPGIGSATVRSRCEAAGDETRVVLSAEVRSSGHQVQGDALEQAAREILAKAAEKLGERAAAPPPPVTPLPGDAGRPAEAAGGAVASTRSPAVAKGLARGVALAGGGLVAVALVRRALGRRRPGLW